MSWSRAEVFLLKLEDKTMKILTISGEDGHWPRFAWIKQAYEGQAAVKLSKIAQELYHYADDSGALELKTF